MSNNAKNQIYIVNLLVGIFLITLGVILLFLLDTTDPIFFVLITVLVFLGLSLLAVCLNWLRQFFRKKLVLKEMIAFLGVSFVVLGLISILIQTITKPPDLALNDFGFYWFNTHDGFVWVFLPTIFILLGYYIYRVGASPPPITATIATANGVTCAICSLGLKNSDDISRCHHCGLLAHQTHLLEWVKAKGTCPRCTNPLMPDQIL
ncbi:MAG: hypothetical protein ACXAC7_00325 [Candidatus Hodarchaeales archaeon]|jgi:hypothetical protein